MNGRSNFIKLMADMKKHKNGIIQSIFVLGELFEEDLSKQKTTQNEPTPADGNLYESVGIYQFIDGASKSIWEGPSTEMSQS